MLEFIDVLLEDEPPLGLDLCLLPDGMLSKQLVGSGERRVVEDVGVALQHVAERGAELCETSVPLFLLLRAEAVDILRHLSIRK